jgi:hypothetical protein
VTAPVLAASFHIDKDSAPGWAPLIDAGGKVLREIFGHVVVAMSQAAAAVICPETGNTMFEALSSQRFETLIGGSELGKNHEVAVRAACAGLGDRTTVLYCDLDRAIHWALEWADELALCVAMLEPDCIVAPCRSGMPIRRSHLNEPVASDTAWGSHPLTQRATEGPAAVLINEILGARIGAGVRADPFGTVLGASIVRWPILLGSRFRAGYPQGMWYGRIVDALESDPRASLRTIDVNGLGFETLDRLSFLADRKDLGHVRSRALRDLEESQSEAERRTRIAAEVVTSMVVSIQKPGTRALEAVSSFARACALLRAKLRNSTSAQDRRILLSEFQAAALSDGRL